MQPAKHIDSDLFIATVKPALAEHDAEALAAIVKENWTIEQLCNLMSHSTTDARKVVCLTLGLVGCDGCLACLAHALHDEDKVVSELAEHAMWSIWFRGGSAEAMPHFAHALQAMDQHRYDAAIDHLTHAIDLDPTFIEAFNQRGIAHYMIEQFDEALHDCRAALDICPLHFGALAGLGHCHAHTGCLTRAADAYRDALAVNPRMHAIAGALKRIETGGSNVTA
jgi:tetratricopeptide (TPR) repeat protein